jgi:hypothetical protein
LQVVEGDVGELLEAVVSTDVLMRSIRYAIERQKQEIAL